MRIAGTGKRALGVAAVVGLAWSVGAVGSAGASGDITELGWWTRNPLSSAPEGGFAVGAAPDGVTAVAAMRIDLGGGVETLVVDVQPASDGVALGSLEVCLAPDTWSAAAPGALADAPTTACGGDSVPFAAAGDSWRADVSSLVQSASGSISLAVVPIAGSGTVPFEVTFEPPTARATGATPAPADPPSSPPSPSPPATPVPSGSPSITPSPPPARPPVSMGSGATSPVVTVPAANPASQEPAPAGVPTTSVVDDGASSTIELATSGLLDDTEASAPRWGEALVLVLIGLGVGAGVYAVSRLSAGRAARGDVAAPA